MLTLVSLLCALASIFSSRWFYPDWLEAQDQNMQIWNNLLHPLVSTYIGHKPLLFPRINLSKLDILQKRHRAHEAVMSSSLVVLEACLHWAFSCCASLIFNFIIIRKCQNKNEIVDFCLSVLSLKVSRCYCYCVVCHKALFQVPFYLN